MADEPLINPDGAKEAMGLLTGFLFGLSMFISVISWVVLFTSFFIGLVMVLVASGLIGLTIYMNRKQRSGRFFRRANLIAKYVFLGLNGLFLLLSLIVGFLV